MSYFDADMKLLPLSSERWEIYSDMEGAGLAAHNMTQSSRAALEQMVRDVASGDGLLTAAKNAYKHVYQTFEKYERYGATDTEPRGVLIQLIEEYARRRFEVEVDLYWEV